MHDNTPQEKLESCGIYTAKKFSSFPTLLLEDSIGDIKKSTEILRILPYLNSFPSSRGLLNPQCPDQKFIANLYANFPNFKLFAQNVLTQYHNKPILQCNIY